MADHAGAAQPGLTAPAEPRPEDMDFFELLRRLERRGGRFGQGAHPDDAPARLGQELRLGFALRDVAALEPATAARPAAVSVALFGLFGPEGPMPLHLTRWLFDRLAQRWFAAGTEGAARDTAFLDFANMAQQRMIALFYRAWADQHPAVQGERAGGGRVGAILGALAGGRDDALRPQRFALAAGLAHQVQGPERLADLVAAAIGAPAAIEEFVGAWTATPLRLQTRLGGPHAALGRDAALGPRFFSRANRIELRIGPLRLADYLDFLPGGARLARLRLAVLHAIGEAYDVDLRPVLARDAIPAARLGTAQLGRAAWLAPRRRAEAADFRLRALAGFAPEGGRAAA